MSRLWIVVLGVFLVVSRAVGDESGMREAAQQRLAAVSAHIEQITREEGSGLVRGSVRLYVFGPEATVGFFALDGKQGLAQFMVVLENRIDPAGGEVAPALKTAHLLARRYASRPVVVAHARIGGRGWREVDAARAKVREERAESKGMRLLAIVSVPVIGTGRMVNFEIAQAMGAKTATIAERDN